MNIGIVDYGSGNFASVWNAFQQHQRPLSTVTTESDLTQCSHVVLPGVGAFSTAVSRLAELGLLEPLRSLILRGETPFLGICVGMQLLATQGTEFVRTRGFGAFSGTVERFDFSRSENPPVLPHMGWNEVDPAPASTLLRGMDPDDRTFYFLHSYRLVGEDNEACLSYCSYGERFIAVLEKGCVYGVQFHPEKSQRNGHLVISNFLGSGHG